MKNRLSIILLLLINNLYNAQTLNINPNSNNINDNINKFIGTWVWDAPNESLQLIFKKENILLPIQGNVRADILFGFHKYNKNNAEVENSIQFSYTNYIDKKSTLLGYTLQNPNKLEGGITHISKNNKSVRFEIEYIDANHIKLISLKNPEGIRINVPGKPPYDPSITLPQDIILTKQ